MSSKLKHHKIRILFVNGVASFIAPVKEKSNGFFRCSFLLLRSDKLSVFPNIVVVFIR